MIVQTRFVNVKFLTHHRRNHGLLLCTIFDTKTSMTLELLVC